MKRYNLFFTVLLLIPSLATAQIKTPAASPAATIKQTIGFTDVTIEYSRPRLRDRDMFTDLTRVGEVWRTGANMSTKISFSTDRASLISDRTDMRPLSPFMGCMTLNFNLMVCIEKFQPPTATLPAGTWRQWIAWGMSAVVPRRP